MPQEMVEKAVKRCHGANGKRYCVKGTGGTVIKEAEARKSNREYVQNKYKTGCIKEADAVEKETSIITATMQVPKYAQPGQPAQELEYS